MNTLTEYRKPAPKYATKNAGWWPKHQWELVDGCWRRLWQFRGTLHYRRTVVFRKAGEWTWRLDERVRGEWVTVSNGKNWTCAPMVTAQAAMPYAELAAKTGLPHGFRENSKPWFAASGKAVAHAR